MSESLIKIGDIEKFSIVDFPSQIAVVVFMQGCPWHCPFCYNQSLQKAGKETAVTWNNLINLLEHRRGVIDAVVFSGGEPLMQKELPQAIDFVKNMGFMAALHTGGYNPTALKAIINKLIWVGFDIKAPLKEDSYKRATGGIGGVKQVKESLRILLDSGVHFECRTTCDPRLLSIKDIYAIADELASMGVKEYYLQKYRPVPEDQTTQDVDCEKFFQDQELQKYLHDKFPIYDVRK